MAGTMPHAIFVETDWDGNGNVAAYAAELPGCATFAASDDEATNAIPRRALRFSAWLRENGEQVPQILGDNWYEVERAAADEAEGRRRRAAFSLDELPPSDEEFSRWLRWMELAREELAEALDRLEGDGIPEALPLLDEIVRQDIAFVGALGGDPPDAVDDPIDRLYGARDALTETLETAGPLRDGVRRMLRLAIADDLRIADALRGGDGS
jgi:hypothetical protein